MSGTPGREVEIFVKQYLISRNYIATLKAFTLDLKNDKLRGRLQPYKLVELLQKSVTQSDLGSLTSTWVNLEQCFFSTLDNERRKAAQHLKYAMLKYYLVEAMKMKRMDKISEFHDLLLPDLLNESPHIWRDWMNFPYVKNPQEHRIFGQYFNRSWVDTLLLSLQNFLSLILSAGTAPVLQQLVSLRKYIQTLEEELQRAKCSLENYKRRKSLAGPQQQQQQSLMAEHSQMSVVESVETRLSQEQMGRSFILGNRRWMRRLDPVELISDVTELLVSEDISSTGSGKSSGSSLLPTTSSGPFSRSAAMLSSMRRHFSTTTPPLLFRNSSKTSGSSSTLNETGKSAQDMTQQPHQLHLNHPLRLGSNVTVDDATLKRSPSASSRQLESKARPSTVWVTTAVSGTSQPHEWSPPNEPRSPTLPKVSFTADTIDPGVDERDAEIATEDAADSVLIETAGKAAPTPSDSVPPPTPQPQIASNLSRQPTLTLDFLSLEECGLDLATTGGGSLLANVMPKFGTSSSASSFHKSALSQVRFSRRNPCSLGSLDCSGQLSLWSVGHHVTHQVSLQQQTVNTSSTSPVATNWGMIFAFDWLGKSNRMCLIGNKTRVIRLYDFGDRTTVHEVLHSATFPRIHLLESFPSGERFLCAARSGSVSNTNMSSAGLTGQLVGRTGSGTGAGQSGSLTVWNSQTMSPDIELFSGRPSASSSTSHQCAVNSCHMVSNSSSPGQEHLVLTGGTDGYVRLYDLRDTDAQYPVLSWCAYSPGDQDSPSAQPPPECLTVSTLNHVGSAGLQVITVGSGVTGVRLWDIRMQPYREVVSQRDSRSIGYISVLNEEAVGGPFQWLPSPAYRQELHAPKGWLIRAKSPENYLLACSGTQVKIYDLCEQSEPVLCTSLEKYSSPVVCVDWMWGEDTITCVTGTMDGHLAVSYLLKSANSC